MKNFVQWLGSCLYNVDLSLFQAIHSNVEPSPGMLAVARMLADAPLVLTCAVVAALVFRHTPAQRIARAASIMAFAGLLLNYLIGLVWDRPRPFVAGLSRSWISHAATGSFPSDHLTMQWTIAGIFLAYRPTRLLGMIVAALGLPMAWARVYLGVHYPGDMFGALVVAALMTTAVRFFAKQAVKG